MKQSRLSNAAAVLTAAVLLFYLLFFVAPVGTVYLRALSEAGADRLQAVSEVLFSPRTARIVSFTVGQAALSAAVAVILALPGAYLVAHYRFPGRRFLYSLSLLPFVLPSIIVVVAMISFYGKSGLVNRILNTDYNLVYNFRGIVLAHVFYNFSLAIRIISTAWAGIDKRYRESAESLGDRPIGVFGRVTIPLLTPAILTSFILVFIYCFLSFGVVLVFGGVRFSTLEVAIYQEMFIKLDMTSAGAFAFLQLLFSGVFIVASTRSIHQARAGSVDTNGELPALGTKAPVGRVLATVYVVGILLFVLGPLVTLTIRAFETSAGGLGLENFRELLIPGAAERNVESVLRSSVIGVILRSVLVAAASGTLVFAGAVMLSLTMRGKRNTTMESGLQIPMGMSLVTVALGLHLLWQDSIPSVILIIFGQFFVAFPFVFRIIRSDVEELSSRVVQSAEILGASRFQILRDIELPLLRRTFLNAYAYAIALPFADLTVVMTVGRGRIATFPVAIYRLIGFRSFDLALALAVIYILLCLVLFWVIDSTSLRSGKRKGSGEPAASRPTERHGSGEPAAGDTTKRPVLKSVAPASEAPQ